MTAPFSSLHGEHESVKRAIFLAKQFAKGQAPVLITGECGTGKTTFAKEIAAAYNPSARFEHIYSPLLTVEAFQEKITASSGSVLYIDEVENLTPSMQNLFIRFLDEAHETKFIASTALSLKRLKELPSFQPAFFYRLNVLHLPLPSLEERKSDIPALVDTFFKEQHLQPDIDASVWDVLQQYEFKGNVKELKNITQYTSAILEGNTFFLHHLPPFVLSPEREEPKIKKEEQQLTLMEKQEFAFLLETIKHLNEKGEAASRRILSEMSKKGKIHLTPQQVRSRLDYLEKKAYVTKGKGRAGTKITLEGMSFLTTLDSHIPAK
ncbi:sigma 54-interacting transcriptional regulator [Bacillus sp. NPDC077027]|uniref:sigma 54-interacting transcriptional regulator n=1 Tax=Bacillus sp. NPDC077027 TaxID=3390548 RepID=UPI003CFC3908